MPSAFRDILFLGIVAIVSAIFGVLGNAGVDGTIEPAAWMAVGFGGYALATALPFFGVMLIADYLELRLLRASLYSLCGVAYVYAAVTHTPASTLPADLNSAMFELNVMLAVFCAVLAAVTLPPVNDRLESALGSIGVSA